MIASIDKKRPKRQKTNLDSFSAELKGKGFNLELDMESCQNIIDTGIRSKNLPLAFVAAQVALDQKPITLRGLMYQLVSAGWLPSTDKEHYVRIGRLMTSLREEGIVPFKWIVDNVRATEKPSSWSGLTDFAETVKQAYRKNFWSEMPSYVHVIAEKDAIAGVLAPVTREFDVALSPIRGYVSLSFAHEIADTWSRIVKPIHCFYLGDFDASGFDLERDIKAKLGRYCERPFTWHRLGVNIADFKTFGLIPLKPKKTDSRYKKFVAEHGRECAELDAIPAVDLRQRVRAAIMSHIDGAKWERLQEVERLEKQSLDSLPWGSLGKGAALLDSSVKKEESS